MIALLYRARVLGGEVIRVLDGVFLVEQVHGKLLVLDVPPLSVADPVTIPAEVDVTESTPVFGFHVASGACTRAMSVRVAPLGEERASSLMTLTKSNVLPAAGSLSPTAWTGPVDVPESNRVEARQSFVLTTQSESAIASAFSVTGFPPTVPPPVSPVTSSASPDRMLV